MRGVSEGIRSVSSSHSHQAESESFLSRAFRILTPTGDIDVCIAGEKDSDNDKDKDKDKTNGSKTTSSFRKMSGGGGVGIRVLPEDQFQVSLGRLMRSMASLSVKPTVVASNSNQNSKTNSNNNNNRNNGNNVQRRLSISHLESNNSHFEGGHLSTGRDTNGYDEHVNAMQSFRRELSNARDQTMALLSAACMESYGRAYPFLVRLHILQEIESGSRLVMLATTATAEGPSKPSAASVAPAHPKATATRSSSSAGANHNSSSTTASVANKTPLETEMEKLQWEERLKLMSNTVRERSATLAVRRSVLGAANMRSSMMETWVDWSKSMRQNRRFDAARIALRHAEVPCSSSPSRFTVLIHLDTPSRSNMLTHPFDLLSLSLEPSLTFFVYLSLCPWRGCRPVVWTKKRYSYTNVDCYEKADRLTAR